MKFTILYSQIVVLFILLTIPGCKKEDYREMYTGDFLFTVDGYRFISGVPMDQQIEYFPTQTFHGTIRTYTKGDYLNDMNTRSSDEYNNIDQRITIRFSNVITPALSASAEIVEEYGNHYHVKGQFNNTDELEFVVDNLGTVGYSLTYNVKGIRE